MKLVLRNPKRDQLMAQAAALKAKINAGEKRLARLHARDTVIISDARKALALEQETKDLEAEIEQHQVELGTVREELDALVPAP